MKIIRENGMELILLDTPTEYLCGPWLGIELENGEYYIFKNCDKDNPYVLLNLKIGRMVNRLTVEFQKEMMDGKMLKARFYADVYFSRKTMNCVFFYSIRNTGDLPFKLVNIYNLFDFDIGGLNEYDTDYAYYDENLQAIIQYTKTGYVGFASTKENHVAHYAASHPYELKLDANQRNLDDKILPGPDDLFSGLQWSLGSLNPSEWKILPVILAVGEDKESFHGNLKKGIQKAKRLRPLVKKLINLPERQEKVADDREKNMTEAYKKFKVNENC